MPSVKERLGARVERFRERHPPVDHVLRTVTHYGSVNGNAQAGAVTFFGFLSFFPILALGFFFVGLLAQAYPELRADIRVEIGNLLPGVVGNKEGEISLKTFEDYAATVGLIGLVGVLYAGLGWLSGMRKALETMFVLPAKEHPSFVLGKVRDLGALVLIGLILVVSVALSGAVSGFSERVLGLFGVDPQATVPNALLLLIAHGLAIGASTVLLMAMFRFLAQPPNMPSRSLLEGALLGAVGFELLKSLAGFLIALTKGQPAFQAFGVALILLIWINYFSRLVMYAAAYAYTSPGALEMRTAAAMRAPGAVLHEDEPVAVRDVELAPPARGAHRAEPHRGRKLALGAATVVAVAGGVAVLSRRRPAR